MWKHEIPVSFWQFANFHACLIWAIKWIKRFLVNFIWYFLINWHCLPMQNIMFVKNCYINKLAEMLQKWKFIWYQNIVSFNQSNLVFSKICFHYIIFFMISICVLIYSKKIVFSKKLFYHIYIFSLSNIYFHYMNFWFNTFLMSISSLSLVFTFSM